MVYSSMSVYLIGWFPSLAPRPSSLVVWQRSLNYFNGRDLDHDTKYIEQ